MKSKIFFLLFLIACSTEPEYMTDGIIMGVDHRLCGCCGGWYIKIDSDTLRFYEVPKKSELDIHNETLPLKVRLNWKKDPNACLQDEIIILEIEKK